MGNIIAVGPREQDFKYTGDFFSGSITLYGSGIGKNLSYCTSRRKRINHNIYNDDQAKFIEDELMNEINKNPDVKFMSYDPNQVFDCDKSIIERTICLNDKNIMDRLNNKKSFRAWVQYVCEVQFSHVLLGSQCLYDNLCDLFKGHDTFVIQSECASGGEGTLILKSDNREAVLLNINSNDEYLVSAYEKNNIPINTHAIIYEDDILIFPVSIQIMQLNDYKLLYQGADFIAAKSIPQNLLNIFYKYIFNICRHLQLEGYRGITGIDAMIVGESVRILEMNNRFQGSTVLLNKALYNAGLPSMPELNFESFVCKKASCSVSNLDVPYSCFTYVADKSGQCPKGHYKNWKNSRHVVDILDEGLNYEYEIAPYATLERVIFDSNIVSVLPENKIGMHTNIRDVSDEWVYKIADEKNLLYLKISLMNQGVHIPEETEIYFKNHGGMCEAVYNAVDIYINGIIINAPVNVKFSEISPFELRVENDFVKLYFMDKYIFNVEIKPEDVVRKQKTSSGQSVRDICLLATDRVRVQHSRNCNFVRNNVGCKFCEVNNHEFSFNFNDICEAIDLYKNSDYEFRHFLIGGRSDSFDKEPKEIIEIAKYINRDLKYPIYVMSVPPTSEDILDAYFEAGVTEIAFNIEIWNRDIARKWMPGKGNIPLQNYLNMLEYAVKLWGNAGAVRSSFIVGLEPISSLLVGIETICKLGVAPILSVFRPIPGTVSENYVPLSNEELLDLYYKARSICDMYNLELGPQCVSCQNNTLSLPRFLE